MRSHNFCQIQNLFKEEQRVDIKKHDDFASDQETLKLSRSLALSLADYIIPGHGKMFKVK